MAAKKRRRSPRRVAKNGVKTVNFIMRVDEEVKENFGISSHLRGANMSSLVHQFMVKINREEMERDREAFTDPQRRADILAKIRREESQDEQTRVSIVSQHRKAS